MRSRILSLILTLVFLLSAFVDCSKETGTASRKMDTPAQSKANNAVSENANPASRTAEEAEELYPTPDYSDFVMPEETGTLIVYTDYGDKKVITTAVRLFEETYPGVKVELQEYRDSEFADKIRTEIPAGRGPDVLLTSSDVLPDIYKTMSTGLFEDLNPYVENDDAFDLSEYNKGVMKGGILHGCRYIMPVTYQFSAVLTSREILEENDIDPESLSTYQGFIDACVAYHEKNPGNKLFQNGQDQYYIQKFYDFTGMRMIDYETNTVSFNEERFRQAMEVCRLYYVQNPAKETYEMAVDPLMRGECLFGTMGAANFMLTLYSYIFLDLEFGQEPMLCLVPDEHDGSTAKILEFAAIPKSSPNKLNAWRFLKILLSDEIQYGIDDTKPNQNILFMTGNPVRLESMRKLFRYYVQGYEEFMTEERIDAMMKTTMDVTDAIYVPAVLFQYVRDEMLPYIKGDSTYEQAFKKLMNELELYKDE